MSKSQYVLLACIGAAAPLYASQTVYLGSQPQPEDGLTLDVNAAYVNEDGTPANVTDWTQADIVIDAEKSGPVNTIKAPQELFKVNSLTIAGNWNTQENPQFYWRPVVLTENPARGKLETVGNFNIYSAVDWNYSLSEDKHTSMNLDLTVGGDLNVSVPKNTATLPGESGETVNASSSVKFRYGGNTDIKGNVNFTDTYGILEFAESESFNVGGDFNAINSADMKEGTDSVGKVDLWHTKTVNIGGNLTIRNVRLFEASGYSTETAAGSGVWTKACTVSIGGGVDFRDGWTDVQMNELQKLEIGKSLAPGSDAINISGGGLYSNNTDLVEIHGNIKTDNIWLGFNNSNVVNVHGNLSLSNTDVRFENIKESLNIDGDFIYDAKNESGKGLNMGQIGMQQNSDFKGGISIGGDFKISNIADSAENNTLLYSSGYLHVGGDFVIDNIQAVYGDYIGRYRGEAEEPAKVNGGIDVKGGITISNVRREAIFHDAGFIKAKSMTIDNVDYMNFSVTNNIFIDGDFSVSNVRKFEMVDIGRDNVTWQGYTDPSKNGLEITGNLTFSNVGDANEKLFKGYNSAFMKVGKNLSFVNIKCAAHFSGIGAMGNFSGGGIEVGGNLLLDNRETDIAELNFSGARYIKTQGSADVHNGTLSLYDTKNIEIGKSLNLHSGNIYADRTESIIIYGDLNSSGWFENRDAGYMYIGGDLNISSSANFGNFSTKDGGAQSAENAGLEIGGRINMNNGWLRTYFSTKDTGGSAPNDTTNLFVSASGINGNGSITVEDSSGKAEETAYSVTYVLNNAVNSAFVGGIKAFGSTGRVTDENVLDNMRLNIIKSGTGTQKFIVNDFETAWHGTVTVNQGLLEFYLMGNNNKVDIILNENAKLAVSYAYDGEYNPDAYMGEINANDIYINGKSSIAFDVSRFDNGDGTFVYENDMIYANSVSGSGSLDLIIDLSLLESGMEIDLTDSEALNIFRVGTDGNYDWNAKANVIVLYKGDDITESFTIKDIRYDGGNVYVDLNGIVVPEPAEMAAMLGAASLLIAALRRRRQR